VIESSDDENFDCVRIWLMNNYSNELNERERVRISVAGDVTIIGCVTYEDFE
jgi:hypothetical protein